MPASFHSRCLHAPDDSEHAARLHQTTNISGFAARTGDSECAGVRTHDHVSEERHPVAPDSRLAADQLTFFCLRLRCGGRFRLALRLLDVRRSPPACHRTLPSAAVPSEPLR